MRKARRGNYRITQDEFKTIVIYKDNELVFNTTGRIMNDEELLEYLIRTVEGYDLCRKN